MHLAEQEARTGHKIRNNDVSVGKEVDVSRVDKVRWKRNEAGEYQARVTILTRHKQHSQKENCIIENNAFISSHKRLSSILKYKCINGMMRYNKHNPSFFSLKFLCVS